LLLLALSLSVTLLVALLGDLALVRYMRTVSREHAREKTILLQANSDLTDRIMHMAGSTWTPPPRPVVEPDTEPDEDVKRFQEGWTAV
jgi:hypothetical protein